MKRILSLALVLVMVLGMIPMALATDGEGDTTPPTPTKETLSGASVTASSMTLEVGEDSQIEVTKFISSKNIECDASKVTLSGLQSSDTSVATVSGTTVTAAAAGTATITGTATFVGEQYIHTGRVSVSVTVNEPADVPEEVTGGSITISGAKVAMVGDTVNLTASTTSPTAPEGYALKNVAWTNATVDGVDKTKATVTSNTAGTVSVTATATFGKDGAEDVTRTSEAFEVEFVSSYTPKLSDDTVTLNVGKDKTVTVSYEPALPEDVTATVEWSVEDNKIATVSTSGKITAVAQGTTTVTAKIKIGEQEAVTKTVTVNVAGGAYIDCDSASFKVGSSATLEPTMVGVPSNAAKFFSFSETSSIVSVTSTGKATATDVALVPVTISGYYVPYGVENVEANRVALADATVYVSAYEDHEVEVVLKDTVSSTFKFTDEKIFTSSKYDSKVIDADKSLKYLLSEEYGNEIAFVKAYNSDNIGTLSHDTGFGDHDSALMANMNRVTVTLNGKSGTMIQNYTITASSAYDNVIVATGTLSITAGDIAADIVYKVDKNGKVTIDEDDFYAFFKASKKSGDLDYVKFDISNSVPAEGLMYTKVPTSTTKDLAVARMNFYYKYSATTNDGLYDFDLDTVTYLPNKNATKAYIDTVSFTCYSTTGAEVPGVLAFEVGEENPFTDVKENMYYYDAVLWAVGEGITNGISDTKFGPDNACTRGQVVTFLWRAAGEPEPKSSYCKFTDVKRGAYYYDAVLWAVEEGITDGMTATTFAPDAACTRAQVVTFLYRAFDEPSATSVNGFKDVPNNAYYYKPVVWAVKNGITNGQTKDTFAPGVTCTRGQIVTFLYRAFAE